MTTIANAQQYEGAFYEDWRFRSGLQIASSTFTPACEHVVSSSETEFICRFYSETLPVSVPRASGSCTDRDHRSSSWSTVSDTVDICKTINRFNNLTDWRQINTGFDGSFTPPEATDCSALDPETDRIIWPESFSSQSELNAFTPESWTVGGCQYTKHTSTAFIDANGNELWGSSYRPTGESGATPSGTASTPSGIQYVSGPAGPEGPQGQDGATGPAGPAGPEGPEGAEGPAGADGQDGATGPAGPEGRAGADGQDGATGPSGADGIDGTDGIDGQDGATGLAGSDGIDGTDGADGEQGIMGLQGIQGEPGPQGEPGQDGEVVGDINVDVDIQPVTDAIQDANPNLEAWTEWTAANEAVNASLAEMQAEQQAYESAITERFETAQTGSGFFGWWDSIEGVVVDIQALFMPPSCTTLEIGTPFPGADSMQINCQNMARISMFLQFALSIWVLFAVYSMAIEGYEKGRGAR